jgi:hypothetical protein
MTNDSESACLAGVAEAVEWAHTPEDGLPKRPTQRVVIYPPTMSEFTRVLSGDTSNLVDGHEIAYERIANACFKYVAPPAFYSADSENFGGIDPSKVPLWMCTAAHVSIGGRSQVLENGPDTCNSESDCENEEHGDELKVVFTKEVPVDSKCHPILQKCQLTATQAEILRLASALKSRPSSSTSDSSGPDAEDSVDEFYGCNPQVQPASLDQEPHGRREYAHRRDGQRLPRKTGQGAHCPPEEYPPPESHPAYPQTRRKCTPYDHPVSIEEGERSWKLAIGGRFREK